MGAKSYQTLSQEALDQTFLSILIDQCQAAAEEAATCTTSIFNLTSNYISQPEFDVLEQFYELYFKAGREIDAQKNAINEEVDDIFEQLMAQQEKGEELSLPEEDETRKAERLSLAAIQKKLESLITLDSGIRDRILPALSSMQCEDAVRQRVEHINDAWTKLLALKPSDDCEGVLREIAKSLTSIEESKSFYELVLKEEPPAGLADRSIFIEF